MDIKEMQRIAHDMAAAKGWWPYPSDIRGRLMLPPDAVGTKLFRIQNEVSEAGESYAAHEPYVWIRPPEDPKAGKPEGIIIELADAVIRAADLVAALGGDLNAAIQLKLDYNRQRTHRHGGKLI